MNAYEIPSSFSVFSMNSMEIFEWIKYLIPSELWNKYMNLSYEEMAKIDELSDYRNELRQAANFSWKE